MSFFKKLKNDEDTDFSEEKALEEDYQKMFKKIARDFLTREDFKYIIIEILNEVLIEDRDVLDTQTNAFLKAKEYENNLEKSSDKRKKYVDVDSLDWIPEEKMSDFKLIAINELIEKYELDLAKNINMDNEQNLDVMQISNLHKMEMVTLGFELGNNIDLMKNIKDRIEETTPRVETKQYNMKVTSPHEEAVQSPLKLYMKQKIKKQINQRKLLIIQKQKNIKLALERQIKLTIS